jgi:hypothetical protein
VWDLPFAENNLVGDVSAAEQSWTTGHRKTSA